MTVRFKKDYKVISTGESFDHIDYHVTLRMNDKCNLSCDYCLWCDGENYDYPIETVDNIYEFLKYMGYNSVLIYFHGGEASIHPKILNTLNHIKLKEQETGIKTIIEYQTNLSYTTDLLQWLMGFIDKLSISYHYTGLWKTKTHGNFVRNFLWLKRNNIPIERFDVMLEDISDDKLDEFYRNVIYFIDYDGIVDSEMIYGFLDYNKNLITKHIDFYKKYNKTEQKYRIDGVEYNTNDLFNEGLDCEGCKCDAGTKDITINANGNVYSCAAEMNGEPLTNILQDPRYMVKLKVRSKLKTTCKYKSCEGDFYFERYRE